MIISRKSSLCFLITWFKNKATEAKMELGSGGVGGFSEYVVWNAGWSWKWDKLSLVGKQEGNDDFVSFCWRTSDLSTVFLS